MIKLAIAFLMTLFAAAAALLPSGTLSGIDSLFMLLGLFIVAVASLKAVNNALQQ